jgi:hypothetical protein
MKNKVKSNTRKVLITTGVVVLLIGLMSFGRHHNEHSKNRANHGIEKSGNFLSKKLDLTEYQSIQVDAILKKMHDQEDVVKEMHQKFEKALSEQFQSKTFNKSSLIESIQSDLITADDSYAVVIENLHELHTLLSDEQREELVEIMQKKHSK